MITTTPISYRRKRWQLPTHDPALLTSLARDLRLPDLIVRLLINRGFTSPAAATAFLEPKFKDLCSPWLLPNMRAAADRIAHAVRTKQKITLYGDYDVDGITGTSMLWHTLRSAGADVHTYIPHRVDEGYGLNSDAVQSLINEGTQLLITIDCGISALAPITLARQQNIDVIVSDHHEIPAQLPPATAIVHPRLPKLPVASGQLSEPADHRPLTTDNSAYPNPELCGAGVAFKLSWAIAQTLCNSERVTETYRNLLLEFSALAALGTIADVVPLVGENRILVRHGLTQLARTTLPGLQALIIAAGYADAEKTLDTIAVGFALAPRLNAAGRMGHAREAVELLTTADLLRSTEIATQLEAQNKSRQATERKMLDTAKQLLQEQWLAATGQSPDSDPRPLTPDPSSPSVLVISHNSFHAGVVGIVASRIVDLYHRPTFVLSTSDTECHGSARSIAGFELHAAIEHCRDLLTSGGGHAMAGGVKLPLENLDAFRQRLNEFARANITEEMLIPSLPLDGILPLADATPHTIGLLEKLAPYGRGNPHPKFLVENVRLTAPPRRVGATGSHLQLTVSSGRNVARCIAFKMGDLAPQLPVGIELNLVVEPKLDHYTGTPRVDLQIQDLARANNEPFA